MMPELIYLGVLLVSCGVAGTLVYAAEAKSKRKP